MRRLRVGIATVAVATAGLVATAGSASAATSSCDPQDEPAASRGLSACALTDGGIPPWGEDMSGRLLARQDVRFSRKGTRWQAVRLDAGERARLERNGSVLVSWETPDGHVQALDLPVPDGRRSARR